MTGAVAGVLAVSVFDNQLLPPTSAGVWTPRYIRDTDTSRSKTTHTARSHHLAGVLALSVFDNQLLQFPNRAPWWGQLIKLAGGLVLVVLAKSLLKAPLLALCGGPGGGVIGGTDGRLDPDGIMTRAAGPPTLSAISSWFWWREACGP